MSLSSITPSNVSCSCSRTCVTWRGVSAPEVAMNGCLPTGGVFLPAYACVLIPEPLPRCRRLKSTTSKATPAVSIVASTQSKATSKGRPLAPNQPSRTS
ncbi:hypothetical protein ABZ519_06975 [Streptomyces collinus]|uniref:hypothetical protein n=1 Tax=Streptomyces collinus TaxID=42684 RepID=UPI0033E77345